MTSGGALELVVFRLKDGVTADDLLRTVDDVSDWLAEQPGFVSRDIAHDAEGDHWIDVVWWTSIGDARVAARLAKRTTACRPMFDLIDTTSVLMMHGERLP